MNFSFTIDDEQNVKLQKWLEEMRLKYAGKSQGAIGGAITYSFTPTSLGTVIRVQHAFGGEIDLTDYEGW